MNPESNAMGTPAPISWLDDHPWIAGYESYNEIDSTNRRGLECLGIQTPHLIVAKRQTAGRGRLGRSWWSVDGCLMFSLVLNSRVLGVPADRLGAMSIATGLAVAQVLTDFVDASTVQIKWPNDIYLEGRKVCGTLHETVTTGADSHVVVGVGINVSNSTRDAPDEIRQLATAVVDQAPYNTLMCPAPQPLDVLKPLLDQLRVEYDRVASQSLDAPRRWSLCCFLQGKNVRIQTPQSTSPLVGVCQGINEDGRLLLVNESGRHAIVSGEAHVLRAEPQ